MNDTTMENPIIDLLELSRFTFQMSEDPADDVSIRKHLKTLHDIGIQAALDIRTIANVRPDIFSEFYSELPIIPLVHFHESIIEDAMRPIESTDYASGKSRSDYTTNEALVKLSKLAENIKFSTFNMSRVYKEEGDAILNFIGRASGAPDLEDYLVFLNKFPSKTAEMISALPMLDREKPTQEAWDQWIELLAYVITKHPDQMGCPKLIKRAKKEADNIRKDKRSENIRKFYSKWTKATNQSRKQLEEMTPNDVDALIGTTMGGTKYQQEKLKSERDLPLSISHQKAGAKKVIKHILAKGGIFCPD